MDTAIWIILAVVIVLVVLVAVALLMRQRTTRRRSKAHEIRENATQQVSEVRRREAIAEESDARARKAQAEADAKAAEAKRLSEQAQAHQGHATESRDKLERELARADKLDPDVKKNRTTQEDGTSRPDDDVAEDADVSPRSQRSTPNGTSPAATADSGGIGEPDRTEPPPTTR
ncbi:hypothetical protein [Gordonia mangrovi]|uniref:hypothetical protein n=1 Tax=Gordonia mangrovi TaxID=2665643 RepID=UPI001F2BE839|nr:hypothetical protein [Gordonia mangrovi]UVF79696.1 hypothetical protein NWF22_07650 [Gordonia mangrovi]